MEGHHDFLKFDFGTCSLTEYNVDGFLGLAVDHYGASGGAPPAESHAPFGFAGRPTDPDVDINSAPTKGCTLMYAMLGSKFHAIALNDPRTPAPQLTKGGSAHYCAVAGATATFDGSTGAYSVNVPSGQTATHQAAGGPLVSIGASGMTIGTAAQAVALAPPLLQYLQLILQALTALSTATAAGGGAVILAPTLPAFLTQLATPPNLTAANLQSA